tara:strand:- start:130 stop:591 length:462 start_codon:yes stop_codon:yes gene_type:complete
MLKLLTQKKIKKNWKKYKSHIETAFFSTGTVTEDIYKDIYGRLMNPFNHDVHLWSSENENHILLTQIQECEFTNNKTLLIVSGTRVKFGREFTSKKTRDNWYFKNLIVLSRFAKERNCVAIYAFSDLDYLLTSVNQLKKQTKAIVRYQFYYPV